MLSYKTARVLGRLVDEIVWVKMTVNRRLAKSHGYYLQHAKEVCLVGKTGVDPPGMNASVGSDIILSERRGQSQKPEEIYQLIEELVPGGKRQVGKLDEVSWCSVICRNVCIQSDICSALLDGA